ncbi:MAG TPA: GNAT family N-acetyltransferase [Cellvibrio sp.]|nr:GNAT family N-acetyltransferase [Cellvibrio sp.]
MAMRKSLNAELTSLNSIMNQLVRKANMQDLQHINDLIKQSARIIQVQFYTEPLVETALELVSNIETLIQSGEFFVIECENRVIACGGVRPCEIEPHKAEIKGFFVHPEFARKGIATELLRVCEEKSLSAGVKFLYLTATLSGEPFYKKCGFAELQRLQQPLSSGETFALVKMHKKLQA